MQTTPYGHGKAEPVAAVVVSLGPGGSRHGTREHAQHEAHLPLLARRGGDTPIAVQQKLTSVNTQKRPYVNT
jgi:hypothetical protein